MFLVAWVQNRLTLLWLSIGMFLLTWLLAAPMAPMRDGVLRLVADTPFLQKLVGGVMGIDLTGELTVKLLVGSTWAHPFLLALTWGFAVAGASRFPAQEIEEGYIDALMCQPVSRVAALAAHTLVTLGGLVWLLVVALGGFAVGCLNLGEEAPTLAEMMPVAVSLLASSVLVLGMASLVSVHSRERGRVVGVMLVVIVWSLLLAYLKPFVPWAEKLSALGLLAYYRPGEILKSGVVPWFEVLGLVGAGVALWLVAAWRWKGRDL